MTQKEFIIPLVFGERPINLFNMDLPPDELSPIRTSIPSLEQSVSIRPIVMIDK
jgi:hypothetical protein